MPLRPSRRVVINLLMIACSNIPFSSRSVQDAGFRASLLLLGLSGDRRAG
jgi:hypothetical protein